MLLLNSCLVLVLLLLITLSLYVTYSKFYLNRVKNENMYELTELQNSIDNEVKNILAIPIIQAGKYMNTSRIPLELYHTSKDITNLIAYYPSLSSIDIYIQKSDLFFINGHVILESNEFDHSRIPQWYYAYIQSGQKQFWYYEQRDIYYITAIPIYKRDFQGIVAVKLNTTYINKMLVKEGWEQKRYGIYNIQEGRLISPSLSLEEIESLHFENKNSSFMEDNSLIVTKTSSYADWIYVSIESIRSVKASLDRIILTTVLIALIFGFFSLIITYLITRSMHKPISSTIQSLHRSLEHEKPVIRYNILQKLFEQPIHVSEISQEDYDLAAVHMDSLYATTFSISLQTHEQLSFSESFPIYRNLIQSIEQENKEQLRFYGIYDHRTETILGCALFDQENGSTIMEQLDKMLLNFVQGVYCIRFGSFISLQEQLLHNSYKNLVICKQYDFLYPQQRELAYHTLGIEERMNHWNNSNILHKVEQSLKAQNKGITQALVGEILEELQQGHYRVEFCKNTLRDLVSRIYNTIPAIGLDPRKLFPRDIRDRYKDIKDLQEFSLWIYEVIDTIYKDTTTKLEQHVLLRQDVDRYMRTHLYKGITQEMVATAFNMRTDIFSRAFKSLFGQTYSVYLRKIQISEIKRVLEQSNASVGEIASSLGFSTSQYLIRIFKQSEGITPHQYRKGHMKQSLSKRSDSLS